MSVAVLFVVYLSVFFLYNIPVPATSAIVTPNTRSDVNILIGGGSLSALAAAITVANLTLHSSTKVVLLEPTNWPGGQLTSSNVPPDFGNENSIVENLPQSFVDMLIKVSGPWNKNPGLCWVSKSKFFCRIPTLALT